MTPQQQGEYWKTRYEEVAKRCNELAHENAKLRQIVSDLEKQLHARYVPKAELSKP